jgi:hypothetical protein
MRMMGSIRWIALCLSLPASVALCAAGASAAGETATTGTPEMSGGSVAAGIAYSWGGDTLAGSGSGMTMQNQNEVVTVTSTARGLDADFGAGGVSIALK